MNGSLPDPTRMVIQQRIDNSQYTSVSDTLRSRPVRSERDGG